jgi:hypothetical protein
MNEFLRSLEAMPVGSDRSIEAMLLSFLLAFVLGQVVAWTYSRTHTGLSYSRSFTQSLVIMTLVVSLVMFVIGDSIVTAFGLLGALALIRFRNVLKDTRDTVFVFISLVVGMAVGTQRYLLAITGTVVLILVVLFLDLTAFGTLGRFDGYLTSGAPGKRAGRRSECSDASAARSSTCPRVMRAERLLKRSSSKSDCATGRRATRSLRSCAGSRGSSTRR